jgi:hypothetical protein
MLKHDIGFKALQDTASICGFIPRTCFTAALSPEGLTDAKDEVNAAILECSTNLEAAILNVRGDTPIPNRAFV